MNRLPEPDSVISVSLPLGLAILRFDAKVVTPAILTLSNSVCPSTSKSTKSPLPTNVVAVITPVTLIPPDPVIYLLFRSRLPPN